MNTPEKWLEVYGKLADTNDEDYGKVTRKLGGKAYVLATADKIFKLDSSKWVETFAKLIGICLADAKDTLLAVKLGLISVNLD